MKTAGGPDAGQRGRVAAVVGLLAAALVIPVSLLVGLFVAFPLWILGAVAGVVGARARPAAAAVTGVLLVLGPAIVILIGILFGD